MSPFTQIAKQSLVFDHLVIERWQSQKTGLNVVWVNQPGPLVSGFISVRTEIFNDSGCPHTLEHICFMGSQKYPYKGILDLVANRVFAQGTNAWTDLHNTTYTLETAGKAGFLALLPVYMDHILYPTMTDAAFTTEVYHINGDGEDSGVVYSEMQGRQNDADDLMELAMQRALYPQGSSFRSETGGQMEALRELDIETIRKFHKAAYDANNVSVIVFGESVSPEEIISALGPVEESIEANGDARGIHPPGFERPFIETDNKNHPISLDKTESIDVPFPEADESVGEAFLVWNGPIFADHLEAKAISIIGEYLTDSAVSPMGARFVQVADPLCSEVSQIEAVRDTLLISISLSSVPTSRLDQVAPEVEGILREIARDGLDPARIRSQILRSRRSDLEYFETNAANVFSTRAIEDFLFGDEKGSTLGSYFDVVAQNDALLHWPMDKWNALFSKYYLGPYKAIIGRPSAPLAEQIKQAQQDRVEYNKARFGQDGLAQLRKHAEDAQQQNETPVPPHIIKSVPLPSAKDIQLIPVSTGLGPVLIGSKAPQPESVDVSSSLGKHLSSDVSLPFYTHFSHIRSKFVTIQVHLFPSKLFHLIPLLEEIFFTLPMRQEDGSVLSYEQVVTALTDLTVYYEFSTGDPLLDEVTVSLKVEKEKYDEAVNWVIALLTRSIFDPERLMTTLTRLIQALPAEKREGWNVAIAAFVRMVYSNDSVAVGENLLTAIDTLPQLKSALKVDPQHLVNQLQELRSDLLQLNKIRVSVIGDVLDIKKPTSPWAKLAQIQPESPSYSALSLPTFPDRALSPLGHSPHHAAHIFVLSSIESSFGVFACKGPKGFSHPDVNALSLARSYLNGMEATLWKAVRGIGLAYGVYVTHNKETGIVRLHVTRSPDVYKAFKAAQDAIRALCDGTTPFDQEQIIAARGALVHSIVSKESTLELAGTTAFNNEALYGLAKDSNRSLLDQLESISAEDLRVALIQYVLPLFDPRTSVCSMSVGPSKAADIERDFKQFGYDVSVETFDSESSSMASSDMSTSASTMSRDSSYDFCA